MKILRAKSILLGAAILLFGASARQASAGEIYGGGPYAGVGDGSGYGFVDGGFCEYGACGPCCLGLCPPGSAVLWSAGYPHCDYARYVVGHGPMFPAGDISTGYSYMHPPAPKTPLAAPVLPAPTVSPVPSAPPAPGMPAASNRL